MVFTYGEAEIAHLKQDRALGEAIERIGHIDREVNPDLFTALVRHIVGQQISTKACRTVWERMTGVFGEITPQAVRRCPVETIQQFGLTFKKARCIKGIADKILDGSFDIDSLVGKPDGDICRELCTLDGVGVWTAEMVMLLSMQRPNVISYGDLGIRRGLGMLYRHGTITRELFNEYRRRYAPYASVASLYLWAISGGAIPELQDCAQKGRGAR